MDIENLKNAEHARAVIETVVRDWPDDLPPVRRLYLYTPAGKTGLWGCRRAPARFTSLEVRICGIQRFVRESKNSVDMVIVAVAVADFTTGVANHIAVVSNDSDFGALFVKIQELASRSGQTEQPPFLWINLSGGSGLSKETRDFVPEQLRWVVTSPQALEYFSGGIAEPVVILSYVSARLIGDYYFDHELHLFAVSASTPTVEKLGREDGELVEQIIWNNVGYQGLRPACPALDPALTARLVQDHARISEELSDDVCDEDGRWTGALRPLAATVLVPYEDA